MAISTTHSFRQFSLIISMI